MASTAALTLLFTRPLGVLWSALAQNEDRLQLFGYATDHIKAGAYALSALLAALAGALFSVHQGIVTPQSLGFVLSTEFVIWAAVGGKASALGALLGAVLVGYASAELRDRFASWEVFVGLIFIAVVRFLPDGGAGLVRRRAQLADDRTPLAAPTASRSTEPMRLAFEAVRTAQAGVKILDGLDLALQGPGIRSVIGPSAMFGNVVYGMAARLLSTRSCSQRHRGSCQPPTPAASVSAMPRMRPPSKAPRSVTWRSS